MSEKMIQAIDSGFSLTMRKFMRSRSSPITGTSPVRAPRELRVVRFDPTHAPDAFFIENREAMDPAHPYKNPAIEWDRLVKGVFELARTSFDDTKPAGCSTLATQIEKYRHSPGGRTNGVKDKIQQVATASCRYLEESRRPRPGAGSSRSHKHGAAAAIAGFCQVHGLRTGFGVVWTLTGRPAPSTRRAPFRKGWLLAYRQVLSLFAHRRPAYYHRDPGALRTHDTPFSPPTAP
jgi:hypothetical protein